MTVGERIKKIRTKKGLTQKKLGELCGMNEVQIRQYELGKANPKIETLERIALALGCSTFELKGVSQDYLDTINSIPQEYLDSLNSIPKEYFFTPASLIGNYIQEKRASLEMSQKELANKLDVSVNTIQNYEQGITTPTKKQLTELEKILNTRIPNYSDVAMLTEPYYYGNTDISNTNFPLTDDEILHAMSKPNKAQKVKKEVCFSDLEQPFNQLNSVGKAEILKRIKELTQLKQYTEK